jgi:hypothetical protein
LDTVMSIMGILKTAKTVGPGTGTVQKLKDATR